VAAVTAISATPRILVVGAGAIGGVAAARLARAGARVTVLDANANHVAALNGPGLLFDELGTPAHVAIRAVTDGNELRGRFDYALITLKSYMLHEALGPLVKADVAETYVSLGNGLVQETVASIVGADRTLVGIVEWGATNLGVGHVRQTTVAPIVLGELDGSMSVRLARLAEALAPVSEVRTSSAIRSEIWTKLLLNSTFSGLGVVSGMLYRDVVAHPFGVQLVTTLWTEGYEAAAAAGIQPAPLLGIPAACLVRHDGVEPAAIRACIAALMRDLGATKSSMLQDLERGSRTEVDVINGGVAAAARSAGGRALWNESVVDVVQAYERGRGKPGQSGLLRLARIAVADFV
jgi:2-dehydropantoate 2-reductase